MHFSFAAITARQILWTLTFAAQLVLLVVLLGRDRMRRHQWFTASIALFALRLLSEVLLAGRMAVLPLQEIFLSLADVAAIVGLLVVVEIARRAFQGIRPRPLVAGLGVTLALAGVVLVKWGPWPEWAQLADRSVLGILRMMQLLAQKTNTLVDLLTVELGLLVVLFGRRFKAGWGSHTQKIAIGLSTVSISWLAVQGTWQYLAQTVHPQTQQEYERIMDLGGKLVNANKVVYLAALVWWIVWLWKDEPGTVAAEPQLQEPAAPAQLTSSTEAPEGDAQ
jgi:hypothetical protein